MPRLYQVTKNNKKSYLYGTIHSNNPDVMKFSPEVSSAFEMSKLYVCEAVDPAQQHVDMAALKEVINKWISDNKSQIPTAGLSSYLSAPDALLIGQFLLGDYATIADLHALINVIPLELISYINARKLRNLGFGAQPDALDYQLISRAIACNKPVHRLENNLEVLKRLMGISFNYNEQVQLFNAVPLAVRLDMENERKTTEEMMSAYMRYDLEKLEAISLAPCIDPPLLSNYFNQFVFGRDGMMADAMKPFLDKGVAFIAVGSLHLKGIIKALEIDGYSIEEMNQGQRDVPIDNLGRMSPHNRLKDAFISKFSFNIFGIFSQNNQEDNFNKELDQFNHDTIGGLIQSEDDITEIASQISRINPQIFVQALYGKFPELQLLKHDFNALIDNSLESPLAQTSESNNSQDARDCYATLRDSKYSLQEKFAAIVKYVNKEECKDDRFCNLLIKILINTSANGDMANRLVK